MDGSAEPRDGPGGAKAGSKSCGLFTGEALGAIRWHAGANEAAAGGARQLEVLDLAIVAGLMGELQAVAAGRLTAPLVCVSSKLVHPYSHSMLQY